MIEILFFAGRCRGRPQASFFHDATKIPAWQVAGKISRSVYAEEKRSMTGDQCYFAYESNLAVDQNERRTIRHAILAPIVAVRGDKRSGAKGEELWDVAHSSHPVAIREMDLPDGVASEHYDRNAVHRLPRKDEPLAAIAYIADANFICTPGTPRKETLDLILRDAAHDCLPEGFIERITTMARGEV